MVTISQIQKGFVLFVDNEIATAFNGWQKAVVAGFCGLVASNLPQLMKTYGTNPLIAALGLIDYDRGCVNIDALYDAFIPQLGNEKIPITIPKIGTIKLGREEFDALVMYIKEV